MTADVLQLQKKAERQIISGYEPEFELPIDELDELASSPPSEPGTGLLQRLAYMLRDDTDLETLAQRAHAATVKRFGRTMHMFAPLYLSNECVSECTYCGFQVWNREIVRRTLTPEQASSEARFLRSLGYRQLLLVSGEHPKHVNADYLCECIEAVAAEASGVAIEVQAWDTATYGRFVDAGTEAVVIYQEVYDPRTYGDHHLKGNKRFHGWRLGAPERAASAKVRRVGLGTLVGLNPNWRWEVLALAAHAHFIETNFWRTEVTVALPRLEPAAGYERPAEAMTDAQLVQAVCALRLVLPNTGIVLSTREPARLRDGLVRLGVTHLSAGSSTEPGGYLEPGSAQAQFSTNDHRTPAEVAHMLRGQGYEPVWKDQSAALLRPDGGL